MTSTVERTPLARAAELYLVLLPASHLLYLPVAGALATAADVALMLLLLVAALDLVAQPERAVDLWGRVRGRDLPGAPTRGYLHGLVLLALLGAWTAASAGWGFHPRYSLAKGIGTGALALGALALVLSRIDPKRAVDVWLTGTAVALALTLVLALAGGEASRARVLYFAGGVTGLPFPRISGPFLHPNMFGDYLVVSGLLLWGRWPSLGARARGAVVGLAVALGLALVLTVSTAWIAAGVVLAWIGRARGSVALRVAGVVVAGVTLIATLVPLDLVFAGLELRTSGIRPDIWRGSLYPILEAPLLGVGASPYLAEAIDPLADGTSLWDAHNVLLSLWGQYGLVGVAIAGTGLWLVVRGRAAGADADDRLSRALRLSLIAVAIHGVFMGSEDLRHVWALLGLWGMGGDLAEQSEAA